jgi:hypothetical protein
MRLLCLISIVVQVALLTACNRKGDRGRGVESEQIDLSQNVTQQGNSGDLAFKDFAKNWRNFISASPEIAAPVVGTVKREPAAAEPVIISECVLSPDARGYVPQITIIWNEPASQVTEVRARAQQQAQAEVPRMRFDLGLHYNAFGRNYYSAILSTDKLQRFSLPSNSALVNNPEAVVLTGPGLFPKMMDFTSQVVQDRGTSRRFDKQTLVLREVNQGITYTMRVSRLAGNKWNADRQVIFMAPVCPSSF